MLLDNGRSRLLAEQPGPGIIYAPTRAGVERLAGSGTYVKASARGAARLAGAVFGLLIPGLGNTEIFEPICGRMAACAEATSCTLLWGGCDAGAAGARSAEQLGRRYVEQRVNGVFFAPLELVPDKDAVNRRIIEVLTGAGIPVVLLDRDIAAAPQRTFHDLVGLDNFQAGFLLASHLLKQGCSRIDFLAPRFAAPTLEERISGYWTALLRAGIMPSPTWLHHEDPDDHEFAQRLIRSGCRAVICSNDATAAAFINALAKLGLSLPSDMKVAGFDDVSYALHLKLTTIRQPCDAIGVVAFDAMLGRLVDPALPPRTIRLSGELIVRASA